MPEYVAVAKRQDFTDPGRLVVEIDERLVVVLLVGGEFFALDDVCTHDGGPLGEGPLVDHELACPRHGAKFSIRDGRALTMPATQPTTAHRVRVEGDDVLVQLAD